MTTASIDFDYFEQVREGGLTADMFRTTLEAPKKNLLVEVRDGIISVKIEGPEPSWLRPLVKSLSGFLRLRPNWDSCGALPIDPMSIAATIRFLGAVMTPNTPFPNVIPSPESNLRLEWHQAGIDLEIEIGPRGAASYFYASGEFETEGQLGADLSIITEWIGSLRTA